MRVASVDMINWQSDMFEGVSGHLQDCSRDLKYLDLRVGCVHGFDSNPIGGSHFFFEK